MMKSRVIFVIFSTLWLAPGFRGGSLEQSPVAWVAPSLVKNSGVDLAAGEKQWRGTTDNGQRTIGQVSIDQDGLITYIKGDGIYTAAGRGRKPRQKVAVGDPAPGRAGGTFAEFLDVSSAAVKAGSLCLDRDSRFVFKARIEGGQADEGIFLFSERQGIVAVALSGDLAPDTRRGRFSAFPGRALISARGTIMFRATVADGRADEGLFFAPPAFFAGQADIGVVALQGDPAPDTGGGRLASFGEYDLVALPAPVPPCPFLGDAFAYVANVVGGQRAGVPVSQGLYMSSFISPALSLQPKTLALAGGEAAGLRDGSTYASFEAVRLTRNEAVFRARLARGSVSEGIFQISFLGPVMVPSPRVLQGDRAPLEGPPVEFAEFGPMAANNMEELEVEATLRGDGPPAGLFRVTLGPFRFVAKTLAVGDSAPDSGGGVFGRLGPLSINDDGITVLQAEIEGGTLREALYVGVTRRPQLVDGVPR